MVKDENQTEWNVLVENHQMTVGGQEYLFSTTEPYEDVDYNGIHQVAPKMWYKQNLLIGQGSDGTMVFDGWYHGRHLAIKRVLPEKSNVALTEIKNLSKLDHVNVIHCYGSENNANYMYIALEKMQMQPTTSNIE